MLINNNKKRISHCFSQQNKTAQQFLHNFHKNFHDYTLRRILHNSLRAQNSLQLHCAPNSTQLHTHTRVAHPCVFAPDATHPAQSPLTQRGHVARPLGASAQAAKECGCRGEAAKTSR